MNKAQKEVLQAGIRDEQHTIKLLQAVYKQASKDCADRITALSGRTDLENLQTIIWQKQYQQALKKQLDGIIDQMGSEQFTTVADYLQKCYTNGYTGVMYDLNKQGIPCTVPINQKQVVKALDIDSKISKGLYTRMGENVDYLKKSIRAEVSRGVANGSSWGDIAQHIANGMNSPFDRAINNTIRIARTEGHRVQQQSTLDAQKAAQATGAKIKKQWCSTLDDRTRDTHRQLDGVIVDVDEDFTLPGGLHAQYPGGFGDPAEDCNCRCCLLQRAVWGLDEDELDTLKDRADFFGLDKSDQFEDFREKYLNLPEDADTMDINPPDRVKNDVSDACDQEGIDYNPITPHAHQVDEDQIITNLAGGDKTAGSCASLGLAYAGQKGGFDVLDFRGGKSQNFFSTFANLRKLSELPGLKTIYQKGNYYITIGNKLLKQVETGKQYYMVVGRHASIVQKTKDGVLQYLELQSAKNSGWTNFDGNPRYTLSWRFGCPSSRYSGAEGFMIDVDSFKGCDAFKDILGYINTAEGEQRKGISGTIK